MKITGSAVLFLVFNRPEQTRQVMATIRAARPTRLYVAADGARNTAGEAGLCVAVRQIATDVDWPCELKTLFRDQNLGCRLAVSGALDWFFEHEQAGIILEDDCVPSRSFFPYCAELLDRYRDDPRILCISGTNFQSSNPEREESYFFSVYPLIWGWATWQRAWRLYDANMSQWPKSRNSVLSAWSRSAEFQRYWTATFDSAAAGQINSWGYRWLFSCWLHGGLACHPSKNLVSNVGFGPDAVHTLDPHNPLAGVLAENLQFPLVHPGIVEPDPVADAATRAIVFEPPALVRMTLLARWRRQLGIRTRLKNMFATVNE